MTHLGWAPPRKRDHLHVALLTFCRSFFYSRLNYWILFGLVNGLSVSRNARKAPGIQPRPAEKMTWSSFDSDLMEGSFTWLWLMVTGIVDLMGRFVLIFRISETSGPGVEDADFSREGSQSLWESDIPHLNHWLFCRGFQICPFEPGQKDKGWWFWCELSQFCDFRLDNYQLQTNLILLWGRLESSGPHNTHQQWVIVCGILKDYGT